MNSDLSGHSLTTFDKSLITSCTSFFALLASPLTGIIADQIGRKKVILGADVLFIVGALVQAWTNTVWGMIAGRSIVGVAVGSASFVVPLYIGELSPGKFRGRLVVVSTLFITGGQVVAYIIGWLFSTRAHGWRWMVGLGALPAALQFVMLLFLPETPRYLVKANRTAQARGVLEKVYGKDAPEGLVSAVLRKVEREILEEEDAAGVRGTSGIAKSGWRAKLENIQDNYAQLLMVGGNRRALVIACMLQGFQQLCGFVSPCSIPTPLRYNSNRDTELIDVLLRHNFLPGWLPLTNPNVSLHRHDELHLHPRCLRLHRPRRPQTHPPLVPPNNGPRTCSLRHRIRLRRSPPGTRISFCQPSSIQDLAPNHPPGNGRLCRWLRNWHGQRPLAAIRVRSLLPLYLI